MKNNLFLLLTSTICIFRTVLGTSSIRFSKRNPLYKCFNPSWTFLYKGLQYKDIIDTYESEPSFLVSLEDLSSEKMKNKFLSMDKTRVTLVLSLETPDVKKLLTGPFRTSPVKEEEVVKLVARFAEQTGYPLKYVLFPHETPTSINQFLSGLKVSILCHSGTVDNETDLNSFRLRDFIVADLSDKGFNFIIKLGKYLDDTGNDLFSLKECLNITPPGRAQLGVTKSFQTKAATVKKLVFSGETNSYWNDWYFRRSHILEDSIFKWRSLATPSKFFDRFYVHYTGERGSDAGGLYKDWFSSVTKAGFGPESKYFETIKGDAYYSIPKSSAVDQEYFRFLGSFMAKVIVNGKTTACNFPNFLLKLMMGKRPSFHELEHIYPENYRSFKQIADMNVSAYIGNFTYAIKAADGSDESIELIPGGSQISISEHNKYEYMGLFAKAIEDSPQIQSFVKGFRDLLAFNPMPLDIFKPEELRLFITGPVTLDINDWKANTIYKGYYRNSPQIIWFWEVVESMDEEKRRKLLRWATGSSTVPSEGFSALNRRFGIQRIYLNRFCDEMNFPRSHTCFNYFDLPEFDTKAVLEQRLLHAIEEEGFSMA